MTAPFLPEPEPWMADALCAQVDPEAFYPDKGGSTRPAKETCWGCEVRVECLQFALDNGEKFGVWGGASEKERKTIRRKGIPAAAWVPARRPSVRRTTGGGRPLMPREHGTERGYQQHRHRGDMPACGPCRDAHSAETVESYRRRKGAA